MPRYIFKYDQVVQMQRNRKYIDAPRRKQRGIFICKEKTIIIARLPRGKPRGIRSLSDSPKLFQEVFNGNQRNVFSKAQNAEQSFIHKRFESPSGKQIGEIEGESSGAIQHQDQ
jgi:hypothetical protein